MMIKMKMIVLKKDYKYNEDKCNNKDNEMMIVIMMIEKLNVLM